MSRNLINIHENGPGPICHKIIPQTGTIYLLQILIKSCYGYRTETKTINSIETRSLTMMLCSACRNKD